MQRNKMKENKEKRQDVIVRSYEPKDYSDVRQNLEEGELFYEEMDAEERLNEKIRRNPGSILVAETDGKVVGNVLFMEDGWGPFAFRLAVRREYRGRGVGTQLMKSAEDALKDKGYPEVHILVGENETELKEYYAKMGYKKGKLYRWMYKDLREGRS